MSRSMILDIKTFRTSMLSFNKSKMGSDSFHIDIFYNHSPFMIQLPQCIVSSIQSDNNKLRNLFNSTTKTNVGVFGGKPVYTGITCIIPSASFNTHPVITRVPGGTIIHKIMDFVPDTSCFTLVKLGESPFAPTAY